MVRTKKSKPGGYRRWAMSSSSRNNNASFANADPMAGPSVLPYQTPLSLDCGTAIVFFRNDLRVRDNPALKLACTANIIVPLYVFDTDHYGPKRPSPHGFERIGMHRAHFIIQSVRDVRNELRIKGCDMLIRIGNTLDILEGAVEALLDNDLGPVHVIMQKEVTKEEVDQEDAIEKMLAALSFRKETEVKVHYVWGCTLNHLEDLSFNPMGACVPKSFTQYRKMIEAPSAKPVRPEIELPERLKPFPLGFPSMKSEDFPSIGLDLCVSGVDETLDAPFPDHRAVMPFAGGATAAMSRMHEYIWEAHGLAVYKETRNGSGTRDFSSKLSPYLALGCLSPRTFYWEIRRFEQEVVKNENTYWMIFELVTRDYFRWISANVGARLFALNGFTGRGDSAVWRLPAGRITAIQTERLRAWIEGRTGAPYIDASMRELANTGYMSNRGRQNCASFLIRDLDFPDWRAGAEYFENMLLDYEPAANWGNWAYIAGVGSDPQGGRTFNVLKQAKQHDPDGWFVKKWCPELALVPSVYVHEPHIMSEVECAEYKIERGVTYPLPIVPMPDESNWIPRNKNSQPHQQQQQQQRSGRKQKQQGAPPGQGRRNKKRNRNFRESSSLSIQTQTGMAMDLQPAAPPIAEPPPSLAMERPAHSGPATEAPPSALPADAVAMDTQSDVRRDAGMSGVSTQPPENVVAKGNVSAALQTGTTGGSELSGVNEKDWSASARVPAPAHPSNEIKMDTASAMDVQLAKKNSEAKDAN